jgi:GNAT superfamily N-acetyltransferase
MATDAFDLSFHEVDAGRWADFERLVESRVGPKSCWSKVWRQTSEEAKHPDGASRKVAMFGRVRGGVPVGILGYLGDEPVARCSVATRSAYRRLVAGSDPDEGIWSLVCLFITRRLPGRGMAPRMLDAAVAHARARGAIVVEAYPVDPDSPSYRFKGFVPMFEAAGFCDVGAAGKRRHVMRLNL